MSTLLIQSSNLNTFSPPANIDSDNKYIFCKFNYDSDSFTETNGKYVFQIYYSNGFPGGDITITSLTTGEKLEIKGYNSQSGVFLFPLDDILFEFKPYLDNAEILSKKFYFKNSLNFSKQLFRPEFLIDILKPMIFDGYLKIAYNKNVSDFDAHIYFENDQIHDLVVGCYSYQDLDMNYYDPKIKDFTIFKMAYNSPKLGILKIDCCESRLWNINSKSEILPTEKIYYDIFFFYYNLRQEFKLKGIDSYPFRLHYENPLIQSHSLIIDYYD